MGAPAAVRVPFKAWMQGVHRVPTPKPPRPRPVPPPTVLCYSVAQVAKLTQSHPRTVRRWIRDGQLRAARPGKRKWVVTQAELERFLRETPAALAKVDA